MQIIKSRGLAAGSLFKILFLGLIIPIFIFSFILGICSLFGYDVVSFNNHYIHGIPGLLLSIVLGIALPVVISTFLWCLLAFGIWFITRFRKITVQIKE